MARVNVTQTINLNFVGPDNKPQVLILERGKITEIDNRLLGHPYLRAHMKAGSLTIVPDPLDPEDIAAAAEKIAIEARARADAAKKLKADEEAKKAQASDDAVKAALETDATKAAPSAETAPDATIEHHDADEAEFQRLLAAEAEAHAAQDAGDKPAA